MCIQMPHCLVVITRSGTTSCKVWQALATSRHPWEHLLSSQPLLKMYLLLRKKTVLEFMHLDFILEVSRGLSPLTTISFSIIKMELVLGCHILLELEITSSFGACYLKKHGPKLRAPTPWQMVAGSKMV